MLVGREKATDLHIMPQALQRLNVPVGEGLSGDGKTRGYVPNLHRCIILPVIKGV